MNISRSLAAFAVSNTRTWSRLNYPLQGFSLQAMCGRSTRTNPRRIRLKPCNGNRKASRRSSKLEQRNDRSHESRPQRGLYTVSSFPPLRGNLRDLHPGQDGSGLASSGGEIVIPDRVHDAIELDIMADVVNKASHPAPFSCSGYKRPCSTLHLVRVVNAPGILKLCARCYNNFVELVTPSKDRSWIPSDMFLRGESIIGYVFKKIKAWLNFIRK